MTTSTDGQICFGILFEDGFEFPWDTDSWEGNVENWWLDVNGYESPFVLFDAQGDWLDGIQPEEDKIGEYYTHRRVFQKEHPFPVKLVNVCSGEHPIYILAVPGTCKSASRGYPQEFDPSLLTITLLQLDTLYRFCIEYEILASDIAKWWLSSYWG